MFPPPVVVPASRTTEGGLRALSGCRDSSARLSASGESRVRAVVRHIGLFQAMLGRPQAHTIRICAVTHCALTRDRVRVAQPRRDFRNALCGQRTLWCSIAARHCFCWTRMNLSRYSIWKGYVRPWIPTTHGKTCAEHHCSVSLGVLAQLEGTVCSSLLLLHSCSKPLGRM